MILERVAVAKKESGSSVDLPHVVAGGVIKSRFGSGGMIACQVASGADLQVYDTGARERYKIIVNGDTGYANKSVYISTRAGVNGVSEIILDYDESDAKCVELANKVLSNLGEEAALTVIIPTVSKQPTPVPTPPSAHTTAESKPSASGASTHSSARTTAGSQPGTPRVESISFQSSSGPALRQVRSASAPTSEARNKSGRSVASGGGVRSGVPIITPKVKKPSVSAKTPAVSTARSHTASTSASNTRSTPGSTASPTVEGLSLTSVKSPEVKPARRRSSSAPVGSNMSDVEEEIGFSSSGHVKPEVKHRASSAPAGPNSGGVDEGITFSSSGDVRPEVEEGITFSGLDGEKLGADLSRMGERLSASLGSDRLSADLMPMPDGKNRLNLGDRSAPKGFLLMQTKAMSIDEVTQDIGEMKIKAYQDISPADWGKARSAFMETMRDLKRGNLAGMDNFLYKDERDDYKASYEAEGRAFYAAMDIKESNGGNTIVMSGVDPKSKQQYSTKVDYDPQERTVEHVFSDPKNDRVNFAPADLQLLSTFEMMRETAKYSGDKTFEISGTKNVDLIIKCIQIGNSLGLEAKMSDAVQKHMLDEIGKDMSKFNEKFSGTTPAEVLATIQGTTFEGIRPDGPPERRLNNRNK